MFIYSKCVPSVKKDSRHTNTKEATQTFRFSNKASPSQPRHILQLNRLVDIQYLHFEKSSEVPNPAPGSKVLTQNNLEK